MTAYLDVGVVKHTIVTDTFTPGTKTRTLELWAKIQVKRYMMS